MPWVQRGSATGQGRDGIPAALKQKKKRAYLKNKTDFIGTFILRHKVKENIPIIKEKCNYFSKRLILFPPWLPGKAPSGKA